MSNLSRTPVQSRGTLDPRSYDSDDNSGELVDRLRQDGEEILGVHVDLISRTPNHIRFDETEPERASVPNQETAAISAIPMETINLLQFPGLARWPFLARFHQILCDLAFAR